MLKFILLVLVLFLVMRLVLRLMRGLLFFNKRTFDRTGSSSSSFSSGEHVEEADFEVIESHLNDDKRDVI